MKANIIENKTLYKIFRLIEMVKNPPLKSILGGIKVLTDVGGRLLTLQIGRATMSKLVMMSELSWIEDHSRPV